jgi:hypothetical protein
MPRSHLHEHHIPFVTGNDVDFPQLTREVPLDDTEPDLREVVGSYLLRALSLLPCVLSVFRHHGLPPIRGCGIWSARECALHCPELRHASRSTCVTVAGKNGLLLDRHRASAGTHRLIPGTLISLVHCSLPASPRAGAWPGEKTLRGGPL